MLNKLQNQSPNFVKKSADFVEKHYLLVKLLIVEYR